MNVRLLSLWILSLASTVFLSVWPFRFDPALATDAAVSAFVESWGWRTHRGDAAGNLLLFTPVGLLAVAATAVGGARRRCAALLALSLGVAVSVQVVQLVVPGRDASLIDVTWNALGLAVGAATGAAGVRLLGGRGVFGAEWRVVPLLLIATWLAYRLAPFIPSMDWQLIKDNLKPLLLSGQPEWSRVALHTGAWLAIGALLATVSDRRRLDWALPALVLGTLAAETLIVMRDGVSLAAVLGGGIGAAVWLGGVRWIRAAMPVAWLALAATIVVDGLAPFTGVAYPPGTFYWVPFAGILGGSMWANALVVLEKVFLYGSLAVLGEHATGSWRVSALSGGGLLFAIEWLQRYQAGHVSEVTDPLMLLMIAGALRALSTSTLRLGRQGAIV